MKYTFERVENGWLITDHTEDQWGNPSVVSVAEDNESLCTEFDASNYIAESLSRAFWEAFGESYYQSKRQGGLEVIYHSQGREEEGEKPRVLSPVPICTLCGLGVIDCLNNGVCLNIGNGDEEE